MALRAVSIFIVTSIVVVLMAVILWQRAILSEGTAKRVEGAVALGQLREQIARLERSLAAAVAAQSSAEQQVRTSAAELREERQSAEQRIGALREQLAQSLVERKRSSEALAAAEAQSNELRLAAGRAEQEVTLLRAEMLWKQTQTTKPSMPLEQEAGTAKIAHSASAPVPAEVVGDTAGQATKRPARSMRRREARGARIGPADDFSIGLQP